MHACDATLKQTVEEVYSDMTRPQQTEQFEY